MGFMQQQIAEKQEWHQVDTSNDGIVSYPAEMFSKAWVAENHDVSEDEIETIIGFGARLSAPGYLDCTEWAVFDTEKEAQDYLDEYYPEDEEPEDEE